MGVIKIYNIRPFANAVTGAAITLMVKPIRVILGQPRIW